MNDVHSAPVPESAAARVRALLAGALDHREGDAARSHIRECDACSRLYERLCDAERRVLGEGADYRKAAVRHVREWVVSGAPSRNPSVWSPWPMLGAAVTVASVLFLVVVAPRLLREDEWARRSVPGARSEIGIRLFLLHPAGDGSLDAVPLPAGSDPATVRRGEELGFSYSNLADRLHHLTWVAVDARGDVHVLEEASIEIRAAIDEPAEQGIAIDDRFAEGPLRLYALFSSDPLRPADLSARMRTALSAGKEPPNAFVGHDSRAQWTQQLLVESR